MRYLLQNPCFLVKQLYWEKEEAPRTGTMDLFSINRGDQEYQKDFLLFLLKNRMQTYTTNCNKKSAINQSQRMTVTITFVLLWMKMLVERSNRFPLTTYSQLFSLIFGWCRWQKADFGSLPDILPWSLLPPWCTWWLFSSATSQDTMDQINPLGTHTIFIFQDDISPLKEWHTKNTFVKNQRDTSMKLFVKKKQGF